MNRFGVKSRSVSMLVVAGLRSFLITVNFSSFDLISGVVSNLFSSCDKFMRLAEEILPADEYSVILREQDKKRAIYL